MTSPQNTEVQLDETKTGSEDIGRITDDAVARYRTRLNVPQGRPQAPHNLQAEADTIRHFTWSYGDDNPLYSDPAYGATSRWGGLIAPPLYLLTMGENEVGRLPAAVRASSRGALAGVHLFNSGAEFRFYAPIRPGDRLVEAMRLVDLEEKESTFAGSRSVISHNEHTYQNAVTRDVVAVRRTWYVHAERAKARETASTREIEAPSYTAEEIEAVDTAVLLEEPRGRTTRYWDDVQVGEALPTLHKGPFTISDIVCFHIGMGTGGEYGWGPLRLGVKRRKKMPAFYTRDSFGAWDVVQRVHWDEGWARQVGTLRPYDYGMIRQLWLMHVVTDWIGDDGWLAYLRCELRKFNYIGDLTTVSGSVVGKPEPGVVDLTIQCTNQRGEVTAPGSAQVLLPTRAGGLPALPIAPPVPPEVLEAQRAAGLGGS